MRLAQAYFITGIVLVVIAGVFIGEEVTGALKGSLLLIVGFCSLAGGLAIVLLGNVTLFRVRSRATTGPSAQSRAQDFVLIPPQIVRGVGLFLEVIGWATIVSALATFVAAGVSGQGDLWWIAAVTMTGGLTFGCSGRVLHLHNK